LFDGELWIAALEVAGAIVGDALAENQVLRARRSTDRVRLDESEPGDGSRQSRRFEERAGDGMAAQVGKGRRRHGSWNGAALRPRRLHRSLTADQCRYGVTK